MLLSRPRHGRDPRTLASHSSESAEDPRRLELFIARGDYGGALALLEFETQAGGSERDPILLKLWQAFCHFHLYDHKAALGIYDELVSRGEHDPMLHLYRASCYFYLGLYEEAINAANQGPECALRNRILFHVYQKLGAEEDVMRYHRRLGDDIQDTISIACGHFLRAEYQEACDAYKKILMQRPDAKAVNVYVAMSYYKLDFFDVAEEVVSSYLAEHPGSIMASNVKACIQYHVHNRSTAMRDLKRNLSEDAFAAVAKDNPVIRHNVAVFAGGETALQVFPGLSDVLPEARLNLVIHHLRHGEIDEAYNVVKDADVEVLTSQTYVLQGIVNALIGQQRDSPEHIKAAQQFFQMVGSSNAECDTILGRQCMASCFFLLRQFEDVLVYLESIATYMSNASEFHYNYGVALASVGKFEDAEKELEKVKDEHLLSDFAYVTWLSRVLIANGKPRLAWDMYLSLETSQESFQLLQLLADECYEREHYFYSAKAFDVLERLDPNPNYWEGKRGACVGAFRDVVAGREPAETLPAIVSMLQSTTNTQVEYILRIITQYAVDAGLQI